MLPVARLLPSAVAFWLFATAGQCPAQTYWIGTVESDGTSRTTTYSVKVPEFFVPWVLEKTERGGGEVVTRVINGQKVTFIRQAFSWNDGGSSPARTGQIRIDNNKARGKSDRWLRHPDLPAQADFVKALAALSTPTGPKGKWREVDLLVLKWPNTQVPNLKVTDAIPALEQKQSALRELAKTTAPGAYYPAARAPADLTGFRANMLAIGNLARQDPNYRKNAGAKTALDLSGDTVVTERDGESVTEKIFKQSPTVPYFRNLVVNPALNKAAQFQAEYQADLGKMSHFGPTNYKGVDLKGFSKRARHFGYEFNMEGEGCAAGGPTTAPECWTKSDSHFRPWFNIGADVREVGLGVAQARDGTWYFCVISGLGTK